MYGHAIVVTSLRSECRYVGDKALISRRRFIELGVVAGVGLKAVAATAKVKGSELSGEVPTIRSYVELGGTGLKISDISFGSSQSSDPDLVRHALDRGITYFDTAESYRFGTSEVAIGDGLRGVRDRVILASKTKAAANANRVEIMRALEGSLGRLKTDYLDVYFNHAVNDVARIQNEEWWEFIQLAKQQGKIRYCGMSGHGSQLVRCLDYALEHDLVDVILVAYNFGQDPDFLNRLKQSLHFSNLQPDLPRMLFKAKQKNVGVIAMKTLMGARRNDIRLYERDGNTFAQAAFRWVLSNPYVDGLVVSMTSKEDIDEYVGGSSVSKLADYEIRLLDRYMALNGSRYCRHGCDLCADACPKGVDIAEVLRTRMYDVDYGNPDLAQTDYVALGSGASACVTCADQPCQNSCPVGIPISTWTRDAALRFS